MAQKTPQKKKKSTTAKKAGRKTTRSTRSKSSRSTRATKAQMERETIVREEIVILVSLAVSIILLISNFGLAGAAGRVISDFMEGLFGQMTYLFPFLLFAGVTFFLSNRGNHKAYTKLGAAIVLVACQPGGRQYWREDCAFNGPGAGRSRLVCDYCDFDDDLFDSDYTAFAFKKCAERRTNASK